MQIDDKLQARLPLPLAQLFRRTIVPGSTEKQALAVLSIFDATVKLLGVAAVVEYASLGKSEVRFNELLTKLARPSLGQWWQFGRELIPFLADEGVPGYDALRRDLMVRKHEDLARVAGLDSVLRELMGEAPCARSTVRLVDLIERIIQFRNDNIGHGAFAEFGEKKLRRLTDALLAGLSQLLERVDVLAGGRLLYVTEVRGTPGSWTVKLQELIGEHPRELPAQPIPRQHADCVPEERRLYLCRGNDIANGRRPLYPLALYEPDGERFFLLNARKGNVRTGYLCHVTNEQPCESEALRGEHLALLARVLRMPVDESKAEAWAADVRAQNPDEDDSTADDETSLGEFELISVIGRGGMGIVYRARQPRLNRMVALKKLNSIHDKSQERFEREIRALGRVTHPNLVKVYTSGNDGDRAFFAMELIEGVPLSSVCTTLKSTGSTVNEIDGKTWQVAVSIAYQSARQSEKPLSSDVQALADEPSEEPTRRSLMSDTKGGKKYVAQVVDLVRQAALAAHALHQRQIIHRDIKPGNIVVTADGQRAVLMDLGLAQWADEQEGKLTRTRQFVGTVRYASPQQIAAVEQLDCRADIYSLGATLWELLALRPLLDLDDRVPFHEAFEAIQRTVPPSPRRWNWAVSRDLETVVSRCLEKSKERRYNTAQEFADDLERVLNGQPVAARRITRLEKVGRWVARYPQVAALWALAIFSITAATSLSVMYFSRQAAIAARREADQAREISEQQREQLVEKAGQLQRSQRELDEANIQLRRIAYAESVRGSQRAYAAGDTLAALHTLNQLNSSPDRGWEYDHLKLQYHEYEEAFFSIEDCDESHAVFSPDGTKLASCKLGTNRVSLWDTMTGTECLTIEIGALQTNKYPGTDIDIHREEDLKRLVFSPNGKRLAVRPDHETIQIWDVVHGKLTSKLQSEDLDQDVSITFSWNGSRIAAFDQWSRSLKLWNAETGERIATKDGADVGNTNYTDGYVVHEGFYNICPSSDGRFFATAGLDGVVRLWEQATGNEVYSLDGHQPYVTQVAFRPDGKQLASVDKNGSLRVWDLAKSPDVPAYTIKLRTEYPLIMYSPDGKLISANSRHYGTEIVRVETGESTKIAESARFDYRIVFSPDSRLLVGAMDGTVSIWQVRTGKKVASFTWKKEEFVESLFGTHQRRHPPLLSSLSDGEQFVSFAEKSLRTWNSIGLKQEFDCRHWSPYSRTPRVDSSPDGSLCTTINSDDGAYLWETDIGKLRHILEVSDPNWHAIRKAAFSRDGSRVAVIGGQRLSAEEDEDKNGSSLKNCFAEVFDTSGGKSLAVLTGIPKEIETVAFGPDNQMLATGSVDGAIFLWNGVQDCKAVELSGHERKVRHLSFSLDGKFLISASEDQTLRVWDCVAITEHAVLRDHSATVNDVVFSPDGTNFFSASDDGEICQWDSENFSLMRSMQHEGPAKSISIRNDGKQFASAGGSTAAVWDVATGERIVLLKSFDSRCEWAVFQPPLGDRIATSGDGAVRIWDPRTGSECCVLRSSDSALRGPDHHGDGMMFFSRDGTKLISPSMNGFTVRCTDRTPELIDFRKDADREQRVVELTDDDQWFAAAYWQRRRAEATPERISGWYQLGLLELARGVENSETFHAVVAEIFERFEHTDDPDTADLIAYLAALKTEPTSANHWNQVIKFAKKAVDSDEKNTAYLETLGAAFYRRGVALGDEDDFRVALSCLEKVEALKEPRKTTVWTQLFLAMTNYRLRDYEKAMKYLADAGTGSEYWRDKDIWEERLRSTYLRAEARALIKTQKPSETQTDETRPTTRHAPDPE